MIDEAVLGGGKAICRRIKEGRYKAGDELKKLDEGLAAQKLPNVMGERFCEVVLKCLSAVEGGLVEAVPKSEQTGTDAAFLVNADPEEERVGLGYIKGVLEPLDNIKI